MNKKLSTLILEKGGAPYHITWASYFMMDAFDSNIQENKNNILSPTIAFVSTIQYIPISSQDMYNSLLKFEINDKNNINDFFKIIFDAEQFSLTETAILAQMARNECKEGIKNANENIVMQYVFRGLIILILTFPSYFTEYFNAAQLIPTDDKLKISDNTNPKIDDTFDWKLMSFIIKYLSNSNNEIQDAFLQSFDPLITPYSKINSFLLIPHDSPLFMFLLEIIQSIIPFSDRLCQIKLYHILEFVSSFFQFILTTIKNSKSKKQSHKPEDDDNFYIFSSYNTIIQYFHVFIQFLVSFQCKNIPKHLSNSLRITISTFLICFQDDKEFDENLFLEGVDSILLSAYLNIDSFDDAPTMLLFCQGIMTFINWASECYKFDEVFKDISKIEEKPEIMITEMPQSYFVSHRGVELHNKFTVSKTPKQCVQFSQLIQTLKTALLHFTYFDFFIQSLNTFFGHISDLAMIMLLISFPFSKIKSFDDILKNFLKCLLSYDIFDISKTKIINGLKIPLFDYSLNVFLNLFEIYPSFRPEILDFILENLEFRNILRILPLFRSLLLITDQSNFINELLKTKFFHIVQENLNKPELQREIDYCVAFVQVCVYMNPGITMSSYNLTTFLTTCLPNKRYRERIMKCFKLGLAQKPPETIILICLQISTVIRRSLENKIDFELATEFISILSQYLNRFSNQVIEELESKSIFELISRLPFVMNDRDCLLNVLRFFMSLFSKFPTMNENLVRKLIYENLMITFDIIPIDDEIFLGLLSLIMGNEVTLNDNGMNLMINISALKFINEIMKENTNENKMKYLKFLTNHCIKNAANCFFCFQSGVLDFTLSCFEIEQLQDISLNLFKIISSLFFGTRNLRSYAQTLSKYLDDNDSNFVHKKEICSLIEKLNEMMNETCYDNATSFFHFSYLPLERITAEVRQDSNQSENNSTFNESPNLSIFSKSFVFSSTVSVSEFHDRMNIFSIKTIQDLNQPQPSKFLKTSRHRLSPNKFTSKLNITPKQKSPFIDCFLESNNLSVQINNKDTKKFKFSFTSPYWYQICIYFRGKEVSLFIDQKFIETIKFSQNISYTGEYEITIGGDFYGDIGDISIYETPFVQNKEIDFSDLINQNENSSLQFFPRNIDPHTKMLSNTRTTNCAINCSYVPFRTTFKKCIISSITFSLFLPLLNQINDSVVLNLFLKFLQNLFVCSKENEINFEKTSGFPLFTGLINNFNVFNDQSCDCLYDIYKSLQTDTLKNQMIEYIFLRFDLIFKFNDSFITKYFKKTIYDIFSLNKPKFYSSKSVFDQMIYSTCEYAIKNKKEEEEEEEEQIESRSKYIEPIFDFFFQLLDRNVSIEKPIHDLFLIYLFCNDSFLRSNILNIINKYIVERKDQIICMIPEFKYYERFHSSIYSDDEKEQKNALKLFTSLINLERSKEINTQTLIKVISYIKKNERLSENTTDIAFNKNKLEYPELVTVFCSGFPFSHNKDTLNKQFYQMIEQKSLETFFVSEFSPFFMLAYCINDSNLWNTFTPIFIEKPDLLQKTLFTLNFFSLFVNNDCSPIKKQIFINVLRMTLRKQPKTIQMIANVAVQFYCYRFNNNKDDKPNKFISNASFDQFKKFMEWILTPESINQSFSYNAQLFEDEDYCYTLYQVLSDIVSQSSDSKSASMIQITSDDFYPTFSIICILVSYIIGISNDSIRKDSMLDFIEKICVKKQKEQINQVFYSLKKTKSSIDSFRHKFPDSESNNSLKENFLIFIEDAKMTFKFEWQSPFNRFIKNCQQCFDKDPISSNNRSNYESFIHTSEEKIEFVQSYCKNLSLSFIRESKFIDSKGTMNSKFKISNEVDSQGKRCYMKINKYFSDHRVASKNRDDIPEDQEEDEQRKITETKRFLDRSVQQSISNIQYLNDIQKALLITLTGRYDVFYKFDQNSVVLGGKLAFNGFGTEIAQDESATKNMSLRSKEMIAEEKAINNNSAPLKYIRIYFKDVLFIFNRRFLHEQTACEIFSNKRKSYLLNFPTTQERNIFCSRFKCPENVPKLLNKSRDPHYRYNFFRELRRVSNGLYQTMPSSELFARSKIAEAWLNRTLSNYQYLYYLNILSGRSFNDTSQYPVFPWIIKKYDTPTIDIYDASIYRDLSIPMAAYDEKRLKESQQKYKDSYDPIEKCMYRSFYSNSAIVIHFLIRCEPFTSLHIVLQSGRFDYADRLFKGIELSFISSSSGAGDFSELLPEFFTNWHFLVNENGFDLGHLQTGQAVNDVILPKWAKNACHFVETNRIALESEHVRCHLNEWIDLIFGCHQKSVEKNNLYHLFNYSDCITNQRVINDNLISLAQHHAMNFGCSPEKLLNDNHPVMQVNVNFMLPNSSINYENSSEPQINLQSEFASLWTSSGNLTSPSSSTPLLQKQNEPFKFTLTNEPSSMMENLRSPKLTMTKSFSNDNINNELFGQNLLPRMKPDLPNESIVFFSDMFYLTEHGNFGKVNIEVLRKKYKFNSTGNNDNFIESKNFGFITNIFGNSNSNPEATKVKLTKNLSLNMINDSQSDPDSQDSLDYSAFYNNDSDADSPLSPLSDSNARKIVVPKNSQTIFLKKLKIFIYIQANGSCAVAIPMLKSSFSFINGTTKSSNLNQNSQILIMHESSPISCICSINDEIIVTGGSDCCLNVWNPPWDSNSMVSIPILSQKLVSVSGSHILDRIVTIDESSQVFITSFSKKKLLFSFNIQEIFEIERIRANREQFRRRKSSMMKLNKNKIERKSNLDNELDLESSHDELDISSSRGEFDIESSGDELDVDSDDNEEIKLERKNSKLKLNKQINIDIDDIEDESEYEYSESSHDELDMDSDQPPQKNDDDEIDNKNVNNKLNPSILCNENNGSILENDKSSNTWKKISNHQILLLENSVIFVASENVDDNETRIDLFDLTGKRISSPISFDGEIMKMIQAKNQNEIFVILSMSTHHIYIINCHAFDVSVKCIGVFPELVCLSEKGESLVVSDSYRHLSIYDFV